MTMARPLVLNCPLLVVHRLVDSSTRMVGLDEFNTHLHSLETVQNAYEIAEL